MSEHYRDKEAGLNGGFEVSKNGLPVNWLMYTEKTVPEGDFEITLDRDNYKEGKQSLRFTVKECSGQRSWRSPGFTKEYFDKKEGQYKLSFWIRNEGTEFYVYAGGVAEKKGSMETILQSSESIENWKYFAYTIDIPKDEWLRVEFGVLKPGTFWIDDIKIERIR